MDGHADRRIERDGSQRDRVDRLMERERVVDRREREDKGGERRKSRDSWDMGEGALNFVSIDGVA